MTFHQIDSITFIQGLVFWSCLIGKRRGRQKSQHRKFSRPANPAADNIYVGDKPKIGWEGDCLAEIDQILLRIARIRKK